MIDTNRYVAVVFSMSTYVRELKPRTQRMRDEDGWEGRRKGMKVCELGEDSIWQGGQSVVAEVMKGMRV